MLYVISYDGTPLGNPNAKLNPFQDRTEWWGFLYMSYATADAEAYDFCHHHHCVLMELETPPVPFTALPMQDRIDAFNEGVRVIRRNLYILDVDTHTNEAALIKEMADRGVIVSDTSGVEYSAAWNARQKIRDDNPYVTVLPAPPVEDAIVNIDPSPESPYPGDL